VKTLLCLGLFIFTNAWAQTEITSICEKWDKHLKAKKTPEYKVQKKEKRQKTIQVYGRTLFAKNTIIVIDSLTDAQTSKLSVKRDVRFYSTATSEDYQEDASTSELLEFAQKELKKLRKEILKTIKKTSSLGECQSLLQEKLQLFNEMKDKMKLIQELSFVIDENNNKKIYKIAKKVSNKFSGKDPHHATLKSLSENLQTQKESVAVLVLHAGQDGKLYDSNKNYIPSSVLTKLSPNIKTLIIYSCHPQAVVKRYKLHDLKIKVIVPKVHPKLEWFLKESIPTPLLGGFIKKALKASSFTDKKTEVSLQKNCHLDIDAFSLQSGSLGLFLNQTYLGQIYPGKNSLQYDCNINSNQTVITLQNMNLTEKATMNPNVLNWQLNGFVLQHHFNEDQYIGSKSTATGGGKIN
jgi:hypothetical protein